MRTTLVFTSIMALLAPAVADAATCSAKSGANVTPIVELYTSQGWEEQKRCQHDTQGRKVKNTCMAQRNFQRHPVVAP